MREAACAGLLAHHPSSFDYPGSQKDTRIVGDMKDGGSPTFQAVRRGGCVIRLKLRRAISKRGKHQEANAIQVTSGL